MVISSELAQAVSKQLCICGPDLQVLILLAAVFLCKGYLDEC